MPPTNFPNSPSCCSIQTVLFNNVVFLERKDALVRMMLSLIESVSLFQPPNCHAIASAPTVMLPNSQSNSLNVCYLFGGSGAKNCE